MKRASIVASALVALSLGACTGTVGSKPGAGQGGDSASGDAGSTGNPGTGGTGTPAGAGGMAQTPPFEPSGAAVAVRKVKNLLTGMPPTDADVATVTTSGAAGLQTLISDLDDRRPTRPAVRGQDGRLLPQHLPADRASRRPRTSSCSCCRTAASTSARSAPRAVGDDAFPRLVQNLQDSFALTAWQLVRRTGRSPRC